MTVPIIRSISELSEHNGSQIQVCGVYGVQDLGGHAIKVQLPDGTWKKVHKVAFVRLEDQSFIELEHRPEAEMSQLADLEVIATGTLVLPSVSSDQPSQGPVMASPDPVPTLVKITAIDPLNRDR